MFIITCTSINQLGHSFTMHQYASSLHLAEKLANWCVSQGNYSVTIEEK